MNKKVVIITALAAAIGSVMGSFVYRSLVGGSATFDKVLVEASSEMNKNLPMMLDKETRLVTTIPSPGNNLTYVNILVNYSAAELDTNKLREVLTPGIIANYKTQAGMERFRKQEVVLHYQYKDKDGNFLFEIVVSPKDF